MESYDPPVRRRRILHPNQVNDSESNEDPNLLSPNEAHTTVCPAGISNAEMVIEQGDTFNGREENVTEGSHILTKESNSTSNEDSKLKMDAINFLTQSDETKESANQVRNENYKILETSDLHSRKKLLVLDVNGLLVDIVANPDESYKPDTIIGSKAVFKRPYCDEFLKFCFQRFHVGVWTSRTRRNINRVLDFLIKDNLHQLIFCWDQSHCTETGFNTIENSDKPLVLKELKRLWEKQDPKLPWERGVYDESNTFLLDDSPYKALRNPPYTAIFPFSYSYRNTEDNGLGPEGDLRNYLEKLAASDNVQKFIEKNPFGQQPITYNNESWKFYQKIIGATSPPRSRKKLIIIDPSGLLVDIAAFPREGYRADTIQGPKSVFKRPYCDEFLKFCFERFNVGVWASTSRRNIERVLDFLMRDIPHKLLFCWDQSYCTDTGFRTVENIQKPLVLKELRRLWEKQDPSLPWDRGVYDESNTLLLENAPYKALLNPMHTAIFPYPFRHWQTEDNSLGPDGDLRIYLERLAVSENVQIFVEQNPFGQRPIRPKNLSWGFYQKVIRAFSSEPEAETTTAPATLLEPKVDDTTDPLTSSESKADTITALVTSSEPKVHSITAPVTLSEPNSNTITAPATLSEPNSDTVNAPATLSETKAGSITSPVTLLEPNSDTITAPATLSESKAGSINAPMTLSEPKAETINLSAGQSILEPYSDIIPVVTRTRLEPEADTITDSAAQTVSQQEAAASAAQMSPEKESGTVTIMAAKH